PWRTSEEGPAGGPRSPAGAGGRPPEAESAARRIAGGPGANRELPGGRVRARRRTPGGAEEPAGSFHAVSEGTPSMARGSPERPGGVADGRPHHNGNPLADARRDRRGPAGIEGGRGSPDRTFARHAPERKPALHHPQ